MKRGLEFESTAAQKYSKVHAYESYLIIYIQINYKKRNYILCNTGVLKSWNVASYIDRRE